MHIRSSFKIATLTLATLCINACSGGVIPDLSRLYKTDELPSRSQETSNRQPPVILIHGAFGARLNDRETNEERWPGSVWSLLFSNYEDIALPVDAKSSKQTTSNLIAVGVTDKIVGKDYYGAIMRTLEEVGGYARGVTGENQATHTSILFICVRLATRQCTDRT